MTATMSNVDAALKDDYQPAIRDQLVNAWVLFNMIESNTKDVEGRHATLSLHVGRNSGVGGRAAGAALPTPGSQSYVEERVPIVRNYGSMEIHGDLIDASASDKGSFGRMLDRESKGVVTDLKNDVSRQIYNQANKTIAQCGITDDDTTIVLTSPTASQMRQLHVGMRIDIGTAANYTLRANGVLITAKTATTISVATAITTAATDFITRAGSAGNELTGLRQIVAASGTLFNVNPATTPEWVSTVTAAGGAPTELMFEKMIEDIQTVSDKDINLIMTTRGVRRNYAAQYQDQRRYTNTVDIGSGFSAVTVSAGNVEVPLVVDNDAPNGQAFFLNTNHLTQYVMGNPWSFLDRDGSTLHLVSGFDKYEAYIACYHELTTDQRNAHGVLTGIVES